MSIENCFFCFQVQSHILRVLLLPNIQNDSYVTDQSKKKQDDLLHTNPRNKSFENNQRNIIIRHSMIWTRRKPTTKAN